MDHSQVSVDWQQRFIDKAVAKYGNKYDYTQVEYTRAHDSVTVVCPTHGEFTVTPSDHINRNVGCTKCSGRFQQNTESFIELAQTVHGTKYSYNNTTYINSKTDVTITCREHGDFNQNPNSHTYKKHGCPKCSGKSRWTWDRFLEQAHNIHNNKYLYHQPTEILSSDSQLSIVCSVHGTFKQRITDHIHRRTGCPQCSATGYVSRGEQHVADTLTEQLGITVEQSNKTLISPKEVDIYLPEHNIAIEYCGLYWHSEQAGRGKWYHHEKMTSLQQQGIQLFTIFEDEWRNSEWLIINKIAKLVGVLREQTVYARNTTVSTVTTKQKKQFFDQYHLQGNGPGSYSLGLFNSNGTMVACATWINHGQGRFTLNRYATSCHVPGGFSKLLAAFDLNQTWTEQVSFADLRWSSGQLYEKTGWQCVGTIDPDYSYCADSTTREHKFNYRRKYLPSKLSIFNPNLSETQNCDNNGILRIWDCGKIKYKLTNSI